MRMRPCHLVLNRLESIIVLFVSILYVPVNYFSGMSGLAFLGSASTKQWIKCLAKGHKKVIPPVVRLKLATLQFLVNTNCAPQKHYSQKHD